MPLAIDERVELVFMSGADDATNRSVAGKFNRIYSDRDYTSLYNVFLSSLVKLGFNKITFIIIRTVLDASVRDLWPPCIMPAYYVKSKLRKHRHFKRSSMIQLGGYDVLSITSIYMIAYLGHWLNTKQLEKLIHLNFEPTTQSCNDSSPVFKGLESTCKNLGRTRTRLESSVRRSWTRAVA